MIRTLTFSTIYILLCFVVSSCQIATETLYLDYNPPLLPITISVDSSGISISGAASVTTPIGKFSIGARLPITNNGNKLLVVRNMDTNDNTVYPVTFGQNIIVEAINCDRTRITISVTHVIVDISGNATCELTISEDRSFNQVSSSNNSNIGSITAYVTATTLNIRSGPGPEYAQAGQYNNGQRVTLTGRNSGANWVQLSNGNWLSVLYLDIRGDIVTLPIAVNEVGDWDSAGISSGVRATTLAIVRIRGGPGTNYRQLINPETLRVGDTVNIVGRSRDGSWLKVNIQDRSAWITANTNYVSITGNLSNVPYFP